MEKIITKVPTKIIQEKIVDKTIFKSLDGKEFDNEKSCLKHEERLLNIEKFKKNFIFRDIDEKYLQIFKYKFDECYDDTYGSIIYIPFEKDEFFLKYFKEIFGYDFATHKLDDFHSGTTFLLELHYDGNGYSLDRYYYKSIRIYEIEDMLEEIKNYFINL